MPEEIDHGGGHDAVHVEDEVGLLARGDGLDVQRVARDGPGGPARRHVGLELAHAGVRVVDGLHSGGAALVLSGGVEYRVAALSTEWRHWPVLSNSIRFGGKSNRFLDINF